MSGDEARHWGTRWLALGVAWLGLVALFLFFPPWG